MLQSTKLIFRNFHNAKFLKTSYFINTSLSRFFSSHTQLVEEYQERLEFADVMESYVKLGDRVEKDDIICVLELDKISIDIRAEKSGFITNLNEEINKAHIDKGLTDADASTWVGGILCTISDDPYDDINNAYKNIVDKLYDGKTIIQHDIDSLDTILKNNNYIRLEHDLKVPLDHIKWNYAQALCKYGLFEEAKNITNQINNNNTKNLEFLKGNIEYSLGNYDSVIEHYHNYDPSLKHFGLALSYQMTNRTVDDIEEQFKLALEKCRSTSLYAKIMLHHRYLLV